MLYSNQIKNNYFEEAVPMCDQWLRKRLKEIFVPGSPKILKIRWMTETKCWEKQGKPCRKKTGQPINFVAIEFRLKLKHARTNTIEILKDSLNSPDKFWKAIKSVFPTKAMSPKTNPYFNVEGKPSPTKMLSLTYSGYCKTTDPQTTDPPTEGTDPPTTDRINNCLTCGRSFIHSFQYSVCGLPTWAIDSLITISQPTIKLFLVKH